MTPIITCYTQNICDSSHQQAKVDPGFGGDHPHYLHIYITKGRLKLMTLTGTLDLAQGTGLISVHTWELSKINWAS